MTVVSKPYPTNQPHDLNATSRDMADLVHDSDKIAYVDLGPMSCSINCCTSNRAGQLSKIETFIKLYSNPRSTQAAEHNILSYPEP